MFTKLSLLLVLLPSVFSDHVLTYKIPISNEIKEALGYPRASYQNFTELVSGQGYTAEEHTVTTEDGYILTLFRMQSPNCSVLRSPPVLMMHGALQNSESFIDAGPGVGIPYLLADSCYDVWVGNKRGTNYGRRHTTLNPDKNAAFWKFSIDEIGYYDVPAFIDHIIEDTASDLVNLVGFSQGGTSLIIACTDRPEYNAKVNVTIAISPATRLANTRSLSFRLLCETIAVFEKVFDLLGVYEMVFKYSIAQVALEYICQHESLADGCIFALKFLDSYNPGSLKRSAGQVWFSGFFMGMSTQTLAKVGQNFLTGEMLKYDFGTKGNMLKYGTATAPGYNLDKMVAPMVLIAGPNDHISDIRDVNWLGSQMNNVLEVHNVTDPLWNHLDVTHSKNIPIYLFPKVEEYLNKYSS